LGAIVISAWRTKVGLRPMVGDINEVVAAIAIASTLDQDQALRRHADCPDDQPLNLELPVGCAGLQLRPDGSIHPVRAADIQPATNFDHLVALSVELQSMIERARLKRPFLALAPAHCSRETGPTAPSTL